MKQMVWDDELSKIAQRHADQCKFAHDCSDCRKTERFGVGQNLYIYKQTLAIPETDWEKAVTDWYEEVTLFSRKHVEPFKFSSPTGHYTALVWADTDKVGCGATSFKNGRWFSTLYTCNYGPNGNYINGQMYKKSRSCSECGAGEICSVDYPGLCTTAKNVTKTRDQPVQQKIDNKIPKSKAKKVVSTSTTVRTTTATTRVLTTRRTPTAATSVTTTKATRRTTTESLTTARPRIVPIKKVTKVKDTASVPRNKLRDPTTLFSCKFASREKSCGIRNKGKQWEEKERRGNKYQEVELSSNEKAEFFFTQLITPPVSELACLDFRYKKFSTNGGVHVLTVLAWPNRGKPGKVSIVQDSPDQHTWVRAQVTFKKVDRDFLLMFRAIGPKEGTGRLILGLDDVKVLQGRCSQ